MRKALTILLLLSLLGIFVLCAGGRQVFASRNQVTFSPTDRIGDPTCLDGLSVTVRNTYQQQLFWDSVCSFQNGMVRTETEYRYTVLRDYPTQPETYEGVCLENTLPFGLDRLDSQEERTGMDLAFYELWQSLKPGQEGERTIRLKDYYDFYPITGSITLPGLTLREKSVRRGDAEAWEIQTWQDLENFFRIPVLPEETERIQLTRGTGNQQYVDLGGSYGPDAFWLWTQSVYSENCCYFLFDAHSSGGTTVDTSLIPGGFGIYALPFETGKEGTILYTDMLQTVYPLDPNIRIFHLSLSPDGQSLLLHTMEGTDYVLTVIDIETMQARQCLTVKDWPQQGVHRLFEGENFTALIDPQSRLVVFGMEDGVYSVDFDLSLDQDDPFSYTACMDESAILAYDGCKLAAAWRTTDADASTGKCGFELAVYDRQGFAYSGTFFCSLDAGVELQSNTAEPRPQTRAAALEISWEP